MNGGNGRARGGAAWWAIGGAVGLLLLAIIGLGVVAIVQNERVLAVTSHALSFDVEVEDEGDDVRVAVLDLRHFHRNIAFEGPSPDAVADLDKGYGDLLEEIGELAELDISEPSVPTAAFLRATAERYYERFRPAIALYETDRSAFDEASAEGLRAIAEMDEAAQQLDNLGERLADRSLERVEAASATERAMLFGMVGGAVLAGVALALATARTVTGLRAAWGREQDAAREVARALRVRTDFVADASHELRTPLTVIRGNAEVGLSVPGEPVHREVLEEIADEAKRMARMVDDLLFLARSDAGAPPMEREFLPARLLASRIARPAETLAHQRGAVFMSDIAAEGYLEADQALVEQAVLNLVDNAAKHSPPGSTVTLRARSRGGHLMLSVSDTGPGIPPEELPLIFERFYQVGARRARKTHGAGLGLAITRSIAEAHDGRIEASSDPGRGTTMTLVLPLCPPEEPDPAPEPKPNGRAVANRGGVLGW